MQGRPTPELFSFLYRAKALYQILLPTAGKEKFRSVAWASDSGFVGNYEFLSAKVWEKLGSRNLSRLRENNALKSLATTSGARGKHWDVKLAVYSSRALRVSLESISLSIALHCRLAIDLQSVRESA